jgi:hypothetical protein
MEAKGSMHFKNATVPGTLDIYTDSQEIGEGSAEERSAASPGMQAWSSRLGMLPNVVEDWAKWHVNPCTAMAWLFSAQCEFLSRKHKFNVPVFFTS